MKKKLYKPKVFLLVGGFTFCILLVCSLMLETNCHNHKTIPSQQNVTLEDSFEESSAEITGIEETIIAESNVEQENEEKENIESQPMLKTEENGLCSSEEENSIIETTEQAYLTSEHNKVDTQCDTTNQLVTTEHVHNFVITSSCAYWPEEGHYESVCVEEGYTEVVYENYSKYCYYCGMVMDDWGLEELLNHSSMHGAYGSYQAVIDTIIHEPVYEEIWIVDKEEIYEEEVVVECVDCGYRE